MLNLKALMEISGSVAAARDVADARQDVTLRRTLALMPGTGNGQADLAFFDTRTLAASATEDLDLAGGLVDAFGATLTFVEICALLITAAPTNTNNVVVGAAASNGWSPIFGAATERLILRPGASFLLTHDAGYPVVASTGDLLRVGNSGSGTPVTYTIALIGRSA